MKRGICETPGPVGWYIRFNRTSNSTKTTYKDIIISQPE